MTFPPAAAVITRRKFCRNVSSHVVLLPIQGFIFGLWLIRYRALGVAGCATRYVCATLPMASTMYARMATQIAYGVMYRIGDKASSPAITAIMSEAMNDPFDGA